MISFFSNKLNAIFIAVIFMLLGSSLGLWYKNLSLKSFNDELELKNENLSREYITSLNNFNACNHALISQNEQIEAMRVKVEPLNSEVIEKIKKIYVKDKSCEAELRAYKELFNE